jgi:hypothetical protein
VLSVDEKSQIQAPDRTQSGLPMKKGRAGTMTHDYKRHGDIGPMTLPSNTFKRRAIKAQRARGSPATNQKVLLIV